jgi:hypothetical protein
VKSPSARLLVAVSTALTLAGGTILLQAGATSAVSGGPLGFLQLLYPVCILPGILLLVATYLLYFRKSNATLAGTLGVVGAIMSIPLALAGLILGVVLGLIGCFAVLTGRLPSQLPSGSGAPTGSSKYSPLPALGRRRWGPAAVVAIVELVVILLVCPQTVVANFVVVGDLINDPVSYDLQVGYVFRDPSGTFGYEVDAVPQSGNCPSGFAYLLNGYTSQSGGAYWYQVGLAYNWGGGAVTSSSWGMLYEVFGPSGGTIFPSSYGGAGIASFSGPVNPGDPVVLSLTLDQTGVTLSAVDQATQAGATETYSQSGAQQFGAGTSPKFAGYFSGLMTECYRTVSIGGGLNAVTYDDQGTSQTEAGVFVAEINFSFGRLPYLPAVELPGQNQGWTLFIGGSPSTFQAYGISVSYSGSSFTTSSS